MVVTKARTKKKTSGPLELARGIAEIAGEKQASDILLLDVRNDCSFTDYFVICSCDSARQIGAVRDAIEEVVKEKYRLNPLHVEGDSQSGWVLVDYGAVVVHIFSSEERGYYQLDDLWCKAPIVVRIQ